jgi:hypothetical protein
MSRLVVYHGTSAVHREDIREFGLRPPPGHGRGVRVVVQKHVARSHAMAWCAHYMVERELYPKGLIATATIDHRRVVWDRDAGLRVQLGLDPHEIQVEVFELPELRDWRQCEKALNTWEQLVGRSHPVRRQGVRRT